MARKEEGLAVLEQPQEIDILGKLEAKPTERKRTGETLHMMFSLHGEDAHAMRALLAKAGVVNISSWLKGLAAKDLRSRLNGKS